MQKSLRLIQELKDFLQIDKLTGVARVLDYDERWKAKRIVGFAVYERMREIVEDSVNCVFSDIIDCANLIGDGEKAGLDIVGEKIGDILKEYRRYLKVMVGEEASCYVIEDQDTPEQNRYTAITYTMAEFKRSFASELDAVLWIRLIFSEFTKVNVVTPSGDILRTWPPYKEVAVKYSPEKVLPFEWADYSKMNDQLNAAVSGFAKLGYHDLAEAFARTRAALGDAWEQVAAASRAGR